MPTDAERDEAERDEAERPPHCLGHDEERQAHPRVHAVESLRWRAKDGLHRCAQMHARRGPAMTVARPGRITGASTWGGTGEGACASSPG